MPFRLRLLLSAVVVITRLATFANAADGVHPDDRAPEDFLRRAEALRQENAQASAAEIRGLYRQAIHQAEVTRDGCAARRGWVGLSGFEHDAGNAQGQKQAAQAALEQSCHDDLSQQALAQRLLGSAYINQGDFATGAQATERAVTLFRASGAERDEGVALRNLGLAYAEMGEIDRALTTIQSALNIAQRTDNEPLLAFLRNDVAFIHNARGEFAVAIEGYRQSLDALRTHPNPTAEAVAWINLGFAYGQLAEPEEAQESYEQGAAVATRINCWSCLAEIEVDRADELVEVRELPRAEAAYQRALQISKQHQLTRQLAEAERGLGRCALEAGKWSEAQSLLRSALRDLRGTGGRVNESVVHTLLGDLDDRLDHRAAAQQEYARALSLAREAANQAWQAAALGSLARLALQSGQPHLARHDIEKAIALIESERSRINSPDLRTSYFGTQRSYYGLYVDILMRLDRLRPADGYAAKALTVAETARARELQDQLAGRAISVDARMDPALLAAEHAASDRLHALAYQLTRLPSGGKAERQSLQRQIDEATRTLDEARGRIRAANPRYAELTHPRAVSVGEIQHQLLDSDVSLLEFWLGEPQSYLWVVSTDSVHAFILPGRARIEGSVAGLRDRLLAPARISASISIEQRVAAEAVSLSEAHQSAVALAAQILPAAARPWLRRVRAVVADGVLQQVPFALLDPTLEAGGGTSSPYVSLPSIGALRSLRTLPHPTVSRTALAVIADPVFQADDDRLGAHGRVQSSAMGQPSQSLLLRAASEVAISGFVRLPYSREEAQTVSSFADPRTSWIALDFAANREAVLAAPWPSYSIVHFATHALLNARHPELSGIVLSLYGPGGQATDGFLRVNDIYNLRVPAELVVLSVCDSAVGKDVGAEGSANLARAFFYAGAHRVLASLWPVDDRASVAFMRELYRGMLGLGMAPTDALMRAQYEMQQNPRWRAPYYWAPYVLQGEWR
jgi:tetratricopeptide (TPR) repeat protein